jgi:hypothetical protein
VLDPWQALALDKALGEKADGRWSAFEVGLVVSRQNGKGSILEARELAGLFLFGERLILHSAHEFKTASDAFRRVSQLIESNPDFDREVSRVTRSHGDEGIELRSGQRLKFIARTSGSGRGPADTVILDDAYNLSDAAMSALLPTLTTSKNPQIWYTSSAVNQELHVNGYVLARVRRRALKGDDPGLCYLEWSVDPDLYADHPEIATDPRYIAMSNPSLGTPRLTMDYVLQEQRSLPAKTYAVERLSIGDWPVSDDAARVIPAATWNPLANRTLGYHTGFPLVFAIDVPPNRASADIGIAGRTALRADGFDANKIRVEVVPERFKGEQRGTGWVVKRAIELHKKWNPPAWIIDRSGPGATLVDELEDAGLPVYTTDASEMAAACGGFYDDAMEGRLIHGGQPTLDQAVAAADTRKLLDRWAWSRAGLTPISPLVAVTLARFGLVKYGRPKPAPATPIVEALANAGGLTDDLGSINF